jgi:hypothetical protein
MAKKQKTAIGDDGKRMQGTIERELPVKLTEQEVRDYGEALASAELDLQRVKDEKSAALTKFGERMKDLSERIAKHATAIDKGEENRLVSCRWDEDFATKSRWLTRLDTGTEVPDSRRAMTTDELQQSLVD